MNKLDLKQIEELLDKKLESIKKTLEEHSSKLDALTLDMIEVQKKTDLLPDLHSYIKDTSDKVKEIEERVETLEAPTP